MTLPPPCFTVDMVCFRSCALFSIHQSASLNFFVSSDQEYFSNSRFDLMRFFFPRVAFSLSLSYPAGSWHACLTSAPIISLFSLFWTCLYLLPAWFVHPISRTWISWLRFIMNWITCMLELFLLEWSDFLSWIVFLSFSPEDIKSLNVYHAIFLSCIWGLFPACHKHKH